MATLLSCHSECSVKNREYYRSAIRGSDLDKVRRGMSKDDVRVILGKPDFEYLENGGRISWRYHKGLLQTKYVYLRFDEHGTLDAVESIIR